MSTNPGEQTGDDSRTYNRGILWFKQNTNHHEQPVMLELRERFGNAGYGCLIIATEVVAGRAVDNAFTLALTIAEWAAILRLKPKELRLFLTFCADRKLLSFTESGQILTIKMPWMRERVDEYRKKQDRRAKRVRTVETESEGESDSEKDIPPQAPQGTQGGDSADAELENRIKEVFHFWRAELGYPTAQLDSKRRKAITAALKLGYTVEDLKLAVRGCKLSDYHMGHNNAGRPFDDIALIFRDTDQIDRLQRLARKAEEKANSEAEARRREEEAVKWQEWLREPGPTQQAFWRLERAVMARKEPALDDDIALQRALNALGGWETFARLSQQERLACAEQFSRAYEAATE